MSIVIKNIGLPSNCYICGLTNDGFYLCHATHPYRMLTNDCEERRPDWCPLVDIVQCKECKHAHITYDGQCKYCDMWKDNDENYIEVYHDGEHFCAYGERDNP